MLPYHELLQLMQARRSVRRFTQQPVKREDLLRILEAARWAPSNHNRQPWKFIIFDDPAPIRSLAECVRQALGHKLKELPSVVESYAAEFVHYATFFEHAPVVVVVLHKQPISASLALLQGTSNPSCISGEPLSVAMAVQNILLAAQSLGLGTCVLTGPLLVEKNVAEHLHLAPGFDLNCLLALGYPDESPPVPRRKTLEQIVEFANQSVIEM